MGKDKEPKGLPKHSGVVLCLVQASETGAVGFIIQKNKLAVGHIGSRTPDLSSAGKTAGSANPSPAGLSVFPTIRNDRYHVDGEPARNKRDTAGLK